MVAHRKNYVYLSISIMTIFSSKVGGSNSSRLINAKYFDAIV